jgi:hypothetical protein
MASFARSALSAATAASRTRALETLSRRTLDEMSIASPRSRLVIQSIERQPAQAPESSAYALMISRTSR